ncbi:uncharacterized protein LOC115246181 [Formica exsecta]|uniref:uncharacterized protein LOC115246181 n=1 Tax=Formica exsecta TaxID=72781 RepID=UPI001143467E|nr:uncharacterized protein LOC115246181 [Formica exsecta]XP_029680699.1 uncharacterized protein LOC115246181 [Formica exsecta]
MSSKHKLKRTQLSKEQHIQIQQMSKDGISTNIIAAEFGIAKSSVRRIVNKEISVEQVADMERKRSRFIKYKELDQQLFEWYQEWKASGKTISYEILYEKMKEIIDNVEGPLNSNKRHEWLRRFIKYYGIHTQSKRMVKVNCQKTDMILINWLLKQKILARVFTKSKFNKKILKFMAKFGGSLLSYGQEKWLRRFKKCHKILTESVILSGNKLTDDQSDHNLDKELFNWLLERRKLGNISYEMFTKKTLKLMDEFGGLSKEMQQKSWLWRIKHRYNLRKSRRIDISQNVSQRDDEANQSNV